MLPPPNMPPEGAAGAPPLNSDDGAPELAGGFPAGVEDPPLNRLDVGLLAPNSPPAGVEVGVLVAPALPPKLNPPPAAGVVVAPAPNVGFAGVLLAKSPPPAAGALVVGAAPNRGLLPVLPNGPLPPPVPDPPAPKRDMCVDVGLGRI